MKAKDFDRKFDDGHDITDHLDLSSALRAGRLTPEEEALIELRLRLGEAFKE